MLTNSFWSPLQLSLEVASISIVIVFLLGTIIARLMVNAKFKGKTIIEAFFLIPIVLPPTVIGFLLVVIFGNSSPIGSLILELSGKSIMFTFYAAVLSSIIVSFPLMYQSAKVGFASIQGEIEEAAKVDGATDWAVFIHITTPLAWKALLSGAILSFSRSLGEFGATFMFAGNIPGRTQTAPIAIFTAMESGNMERGWQWVIAILLISLVMLIFTNLIKTNRVL